jgi:hypothetical protein
MVLGLALFPSASASGGSDGIEHPAFASSARYYSSSSFSSPGIRHAYGLLWLQIDPDDVSISLDGEYLDKDVWLISVPPGDHEIRVSKPGYRPQHSRFGIAPGQNVRLDVSLAPDSNPGLPGQGG